MAKDIFQDMVRVKRARQAADREKVTPSDPAPEKKENKQKKQEGGSRYGMWLLAVIAVIFLFFAVSLLFTSAEVVVNPEVQEVSLDGSFSAVKGGSGNEISFDLVVLSGEKKETVSGGEEKEVYEKATGRVVIYNTFSSASQRLDIDTRLEGSNGKLYKTEKGIVVPGMKGDGTPGSIEVGIYAAEAGEEYNSDPLDFKIVGFKGGPKYEKFYGRSNGEIKGGMTGMVQDISDQQKAELTERLEVSLTENLTAKALDQIPSGFILWEEATFIDRIEEKTEAGAEEGTTKVTLSGSLYGFLFDEEKLSKSIIEKSVPEYDGSEAYVHNLKELSFTLLDKENITYLNAKNIKDINFTLSGTPEVVYKINPDALSAEFLGKNKKEFERILSEYSHIKSADLSLRPVWKKTFPEDMNDLKILVNYP